MSDSPATNTRGAPDRSGAALNLAMLLLGGAVLLALVVKACGAQPDDAFAAFAKGAFSSGVAWGQTLSRALILTLCGLSVALSFRCGLFNIGADGQMTAGMIAAAALGTRLLPSATPWFLGLPLLLLAGMLAGGAWSLIAGALKHWRGVSEVISTLMLNLVALIVLPYMVSYPFLLQRADTSERTGTALPDALQLHGWDGTSFHSGVFLILPAALLVWLAVYHTRAGLSLRATGLNAKAARACGIPVRRVTALVFASAGALSGLAGSMGVAAFGYLTFEPLYPNYGYMAIAVALVAGLHPLGVVPAAFFFAVLEVGTQAMESSAGVPHEVVYAIQGAVILLLLARGVRLPGTQAAGTAAETGSRE